MGRIEWYGPTSGPRSVEEIVGYSKPSVSALMRYSTAMSKEADDTLSMHYDQGHSHIGVIHKGEAEHKHRAKLDSVVYLADSEQQAKTPKGGKKKNQWRSVQSIEFGHDIETKDGTKTVPGLAPLQKAAKKMVAKRRLSI